MFEITYAGPEFAVKGPASDTTFHKTMEALGGVPREFGPYYYPLTLSKLQEVYLALKPYGKIGMDQAMQTAVKRLKNGEILHLTVGTGLENYQLNYHVELEAPKIAAALKDYQKTGVGFLTSHKSALLADHPGSGKTLMAIATMINANVTGDILVLAPSIAATVSWPEEFEQWAPLQDEYLVVEGTAKQREFKLGKLRGFPNSKRRWFLCNHEMARAKYHGPEASDEKGWYEYHWKQLFFYDYMDSRPKNPRQWAAIIVDESHRCLVTKKSQAWKQQQTRCGMGKLQIKPGGRKIAMSGTPFRGKVENLWGTLNWLDPEQYTSLNQWNKYYFDARPGYWGGIELGELTEVKERELFDELSDYMIRRTKAEIMPDLPPKSYAGHMLPGVDAPPRLKQGFIGHWLPMSGKQKKAYEEMAQLALAHLDSGDLMANGVLAELTRLKQFAGCYGRLDTKEIKTGGFADFIEEFKPSLPSNKFSWLLEFLEERGIYKNTTARSMDDAKIVIASQFTSVINLFHAELNKKGIQSYRITGGTPNAERKLFVQEFQKPTGVQVMFVNTKAGGVALTLDRADELVILDETFIPDDQEQVEDRIHRTSRVHNVIIHYVRSLGSVEESIALTTIKRDVSQKVLLDGLRGIDVARQILSEKGTKQ